MPHQQSAPILKQSDLNESFQMRRAFVFWFLQVLIFLALDQFTKAWAFTQPDAKLVPGIGKVNFENANFAFSLPLPTWLMGVVYAAALFAIATYLVKNFYSISSFHRLAWALIVAGAVSNIAERVIRGSVRDFIYLFSGIFNLADGFIIAGVVILLLYQRAVKREA